MAPLLPLHPRLRHVPLAALRRGYTTLPCIGKGTVRVKTDHLAHENRKSCARECARKSEARRIRIGRGAAHGFWKGSEVLLALLSGGGGFGC
jgi:hypothetical protein